MKKKEHIVKTVKPGSIAEELEIEPHPVDLLLPFPYEAALRLHLRPWAVQDGIHEEIAVRLHSLDPPA